MVVAGGDIPSECEGAGGVRIRRGRGEGRIKDGAVGEDGQLLNSGDIT